MKNSIITISFTAATIAMTSCGEKEAAPDATGIFEATDVTISAKVAGEIMTLTIEEGDTVSEGQTLGTIDATQLRLKREQLSFNRASTRDNILDIEQQVAAMQQQKANLTIELNRFEGLLREGAASQKQVDDLRYQIEVTQKQIDGARSKMRGSNEALANQGEGIGAQIALIDSQIADSDIKAPRGGTVIDKYCEAGEYATPGRPIVRIADLKNITLRAYVCASQYNTLSLNQKVKVRIDDRDEPYEGRVTWIAKRAEFTPKTIQTKDERANLVYAIKISIVNDDMIKIGMYGDCYFD